MFVLSVAASDFHSEVLFYCVNVPMHTVCQALCITRSDTVTERDKVCACVWCLADLDCRSHLLFVSPLCFPVTELPLWYSVPLCETDSPADSSCEGGGCRRFVSVNLDVHSADGQAACTTPLQDEYHSQTVDFPIRSSFFMAGLKYRLYCFRQCVCWLGVWVCGCGSAGVRSGRHTHFPFACAAH